MTEGERAVNPRETVAGERSVNFHEAVAGERSVDSHEAVAGERSVDSHETVAGEILADKYEVTGKAGNGGSGTVYRVWDRNLEKYMAVKEMEGVGVWEVEKEILKELRHPALPVVTDCFENKGKKYLVMDYIEGTTLLQYLDKYARVRQGQAVAWAKELAQVLVCLHTRRIPVIYRDMKPSNIMIDQNNRIRLIDFGTVYFKYGDGGCGDGRPSCVRAGTFGYAAPEQLSEKDGILTDERSDIYGLGATLHHMLTGKNPTRPPFFKAPIRSYDRALSPELEKIVKKALMPEKEKRYKNAGLLLEELNRFEEKEKKKRIGRRTVTALYYSVLSLLAAGFCLSYYRAELYEYVALKRVLWEERMLFFSLCLLAFCFAKWAFISLTGRGRKRTLRTVKSIYLSEKKNAGLPFFLLSVTLCVSLFGLKVTAASEEKLLPVVVRDTDGRRLLIRYDAVYPADDGLRLFLPPEDFEEGQEYTLTLECTQRTGGDTKVRVFYLKR